MQNKLFCFDSGGSPKWAAPEACTFSSLHGFAKFAKLCHSHAVPVLPRVYLYTSQWGSWE